MASRTLSPTMVKTETQYLAEIIHKQRSVSLTLLTAGPLQQQQLTDHRQVKLSGRQHVLENEQQNGDGQEDGHFEAQLFTSGLADEKRGQIQDKEKKQWYDEIDHIEHWLPYDCHLGKQQTVKSVTNQHTWRMGKEMLSNTVA